MRIEVAALLAAAIACGGAQRSGVSDCPGYAVAMRAPLARLARAADAFAAANLADAAEAARELAGKLDKERETLATLHITDRDLHRAHAKLPPALAEMSAALRYLADVLTRRDETQ